jgi:hypothetical protein
MYSNASLSMLLPNNPLLLVSTMNGLPERVRLQFLFHSSTHQTDYL